MNHHSRKKWGLPFLLLALSLTGCNDEGAFGAGDNGGHGGDHADIIAQTYVVAVNSAGEGEVSPAKNSVSAGDLSVFSVMPYEGYRIDSVSVTKGDCPLKNVTINSLDDGQVNYTAGPVNSDCAIDVKFVDKNSVPLFHEVSMTVTPAVGGTIQLEDGTPVTSTNFYLAPDESKGFSVEAKDNYRLKEINLDDSAHCSIATVI
ncbi:InlB B-repeat-containing protein, partial [Vibrio sagamiensis]|uniref:InlB B-repeat-containing protein n=2 Tax=Vibrio sagamiensis TaxID=512650 RepID=UPI000587DA67